MATPPTQCPCGLSYEAVEKYNKVNVDTLCCTALDVNGNPCNKRLADHPKETEPPQIQIQILVHKQSNGCNYFA